MSDQWPLPDKEPSDEWYNGYTTGAITGFIVGLLIGVLAGIPAIYFAMKTILS